MKFKNLSITQKVILVFIIVFILATFSFAHLLDKAYEGSLLFQARNIAGQITILNRWASGLGGFWTKDRYTPGVGYLIEFETKNGTAKAFGTGETLKKFGKTYFYLCNHAIVMHELSNVSKKRSDWSFRIVSEKYLNALDKPDRWELLAINKIKGSKVKEYWGWDGKKFRYAKPLYIKEDCLKCHGSPEKISQVIMKSLRARYGNAAKKVISYKIGDLSGIISVTLIPPGILSRILSFIDIWSVGALILAFFIFWYFAKKEIKEPIGKLTKAAHDISLGKLDVDLGLKGLKESNVRDEITKLAIAIDRLKVSIQIAMDRLRKKK